MTMRSTASVIKTVANRPINAIAPNITNDNKMFNIFVADFFSRWCFTHQISYNIYLLYFSFSPIFFRQGFSCVDLQNAGMRQSGVYYLQIRGTTYWFLKVYCEQDIADGGWTVSNSHSVMLENWYLLLFFSLNRCFMRECVCVYVSDEVIT